MSTETRKPFVEVMAADPGLRERLLALLRDSGLVRLDGNSPPDLVCVGCADRFPVGEIEAALRRSTAGQRIPVVLMTSRGSEDLAVEALRYGISEYIRIPFSRQQLSDTLLSLNRPSDSSRTKGSDCLLGHSSAIREIRAYLERVAAADSNVLVTGATGTGKELVAQIIHGCSSRGSKPLVCINCAALPDSLLESELFGYERGAFTGAHARQEGKLKLADRGTVFLDEIGDMSLYAQAKVERNEKEKNKR